MGSINYEKWALDMCGLLDAIEKALNDEDHERAETLIMGRFDMAEKHGLKVSISGTQPSVIQ